tara:strand:+ start:398 stop:598 length:201 start_codon:yes stop_codon:yes gene_type:complete
MNDEQCQRIIDVLRDIDKTLKTTAEAMREILGHYNGIVPQMRENVDRANKFGRIAETNEVDDTVTN